MCAHTHVRTYYLPPTCIRDIHGNGQKEKKCHQRWNVIFLFQTNHGNYIPFIIFPFRFTWFFVLRFVARALTLTHTLTIHNWPNGATGFGKNEIITIITQPRAAYDAMMFCRKMGCYDFAYAGCRVHGAATRAHRTRKKSVQDCSSLPPRYYPIRINNNNNLTLL